MVGPTLSIAGAATEDTAGRCIVVIVRGRWHGAETFSALLSARRRDPAPYSVSEMLKVNVTLFPLYSLHTESVSMRQWSVHCVAQTMRSQSGLS